MISDVNKAIAAGEAAVKAAISHYEHGRDALKKYLDGLAALDAEGRSVKGKSEDAETLLKKIRDNLDALYSIK